MKLKSGNIELRSFRKTDAKKMLELANNEKISQNLRDGFPYPYALKDAENFIQNCQSQKIKSSFAIFCNGVYVGNIGLAIGQDIYRKSAELGYFIGEPFWNKGIATIAVNLITEYGFKHLDLVRIYSGIFEYNTPSMRVLEKCGFIREAVLRKSVIKKNKIWDEVRYAKINPKYDL